MELVADIFLIAGALGTGFYCIVLSRRLQRFTNLEKGVGGAIAVLSNQVEGMTKALAEARRTTTSSAKSLEGLTNRAEGVAQRLELLVASMHDLPVDPLAKRAEVSASPEETGKPPAFQTRRRQFREAAE